jgi:hypothetical protein
MNLAMDVTLTIMTEGMYSRVLASKWAAIPPGVLFAKTVVKPSTVLGTNQAVGYRDRYIAWRASTGRQPIPPGYEAHHRIPQEYRYHPEFKGFDFDDPRNIRAVGGWRSGINIHQMITNAWTTFRQVYRSASREPTRAEIKAFARRIDGAYGRWYLK